MEISLPNDPDTKTNVELSQKLCELLGEGEVGTVGCWYFTINLGPEAAGRGPEKGYHIDTRRDPKKWFVSGCWPWDGSTQHRHEDAGRIGVSKKRGVESLANEIKKRLKPDYEVQWAEMKALATKHAQRQEQTEAVIRELAELTEEKNLSRQALQGGNLRPYRYSINEVRINSPDSITIETMSLPLDIAKEVIALLKAKCPK